MGGAKYIEVQYNHLAAKLSSEGSFSCCWKQHPRIFPFSVYFYSTVIYNLLYIINNISVLLP